MAPEKPQEKPQRDLRDSVDIAELEYLRDSGLATEENLRVLRSLGKTATKDVA